MSLEKHVSRNSLAVLTAVAFVETGPAIADSVTPVVLVIASSVPVRAFRLMSPRTVVPCHIFTTLQPPISDTTLELTIIRSTVCF